MGESEYAGAAPSAPGGSSPGPGLSRPAIFGVYWAYTFPSASVAVVGIRYAASEESGAGESSTPAEALAWILVAMAMTAFVLVLSRMSWHHIQVLRGEDTWDDPLAKKYAASLRRKPGVEAASAESYATA